MKHNITILAICLSPMHFLWAAEFIEVPDALVEAVSADGSTVVGRSDFALPRDQQTAWRWTKHDGLQDLGTTEPGTRSVARGVSADGTIVVGSVTVEGQDWEPMIWSAESGMSRVEMPKESNNGVFYDVSADGDIAVGMIWFNREERSAIRWTNASGIEILGELSGVEVSNAESVSANGDNIAGWADSDAFYLSEEGTLKFLGLVDYRGQPSISSNGKVIVGGTQNEPFRWTEQTGVKELGRLSGARSAGAFDANFDGSAIVGMTQFDSSPERGFVWDEVRGVSDLRRLLIDEHGFESLPSLGRPTAISDDTTTIAGYTQTEVGGAVQSRDAWIVLLDRPIHWIPGDTDLDSDVDFGDFLNLSKKFGLPGGWEHGDFDLNGTVEFDDFLMLAKNFGLTSIPDQQAAVGSVPEPSAHSLFTLGFFAMVHSRRTRRKR